MAATRESRAQKIIVEKRNGEKLVGILHETDSPDVVVLCHGYRSSKEQKTIVAVSTAIEKENLSAFRFDFSGNGESDGEFEYSNYWGEVDDLRTIVLYFISTGRNVSAIIGHSKGAAAVLLYASKYDDVPAVVNVSGRFDMLKGAEALLGVEFMKTMLRDGYIEVQDNQNDMAAVQV